MTPPEPTNDRMPELWSDAGRDASGDDMAAARIPADAGPAALEAGQAAGGPVAPGAPVPVGTDPVRAAGGDVAEHPTGAPPEEGAAEPDSIPDGGEIHGGPDDSEPDAIPDGGEPVAVAGGGEAAACPYVTTADGWRSTEPNREHRCSALDPAAVVALDKQRRLCLVAAHVTCPTYVAAREARTAALAGLPDGWEPGRRFVRTGPVVIEAAPRRRPSPVAVGSHRLMEAAAATLAVVVLVLAGWRVLGGGAAPSPTPAPSVATSSADASASSPANPVTTPEATADVASVPPATPATSAVPSQPAATVEPTPAPSVAKRTYKVKSGDTLSGIAAKFGVTVTAIVKANKIKDPSHIHRGQVLVIP